MRVALLDANVLLALAWPNHQHHVAAQRWLRAEAAEGWATCALTQLAFIRLSSNPAYSSAAVTPKAAAQLLAQLTRAKGHQFWKDISAAAPSLYARAEGHRQVNDAYLVALAARRRGRVVTFDAPLRAHAMNPETVQLLTP